MCSKELEMQPAKISPLPFATALSAACWTASAAFAAATAEPQQGLQSLSDGVATIVAQTGALLASGYDKAPALMIALSAFLMLPAAALVSFLVQRMARRRADRAASRAAELRAGAAAQAGETPAAGPAPLWSHQAWLSLDGSAATLPLAGQVIRIGRHQDNDIRLPDASVHRYHAVIEHTPEEEFVITDLSGKEGNGLRINGERLAKAQLVDGDVIELGRTRLKFESVPV
jgi:hypothetical protein